MTEHAFEQIDIDTIARESFDYEQLRPGQKEAIRAVLAGHDTLAVMPTGSGKSAIYQISALKIPGVTLIVSPLIALQQDQVEALEEQDVAEAALLNSSLRTSERKQVLADLADEKLEYLFLAPEQFSNPETLAQVQAAKPSLFVVDEAHCISEWGHNFRPEYLRLDAIIEALGHPAVLALTATAAPNVRAEIIERLGMRDPHVIVRGFNRPNIWLQVERFADESHKRKALLACVANAQKPGIVYAATRKTAEELAEAIGKTGTRAAFYHAGMSAADREQTQRAFMDDELEVIVATTAFGMGVDKPNVRFVYHHDISDSLDAYYQEIGRAGRDDAPAEAVLFYTPGDLGIRRFFAGGGQVDADEIEQVARAIRKRHGPVDPRELLDELELSQTKLGTAISRLEEVGAIEVQQSGEVIATRTGRRVTSMAEEASQAQERYEQHRKSRLEMIRGYAEGRGCRRAALLSYFGEAFEPPCNTCDNCAAGRVAAVNASAEPFPVSSRVKHTTWGAGVVLRYDADTIVVLFDSVGYKNLALDLVRANGLLKPL